MKPKTADDVFELMDAYITSAALNAAMELGLFWLLAERPLDAPAVAQTLDIPPNRCQYWLQLLSTTGLIERGPAGYAPSSTTQSAILDACSQDTWAYLARDARDRFPAIIDLALHLRQSGSTWAAQGLVPPDYFEQMVDDPERARDFTRGLYEIHVPLAEALAETLDMSGVKRLMDLGGGSGVMSMALLRRCPDLSAVVVDIANVCAAGREIAAEQSLEDRLIYHVADFTRDELPSGFDMILDCDVGCYNETMLPNIWSALNPGGRLVIVDQFARESGLAPETLPYPLWIFLGSLERPDASYPTVTEVQTRLTRAGFHLLSEAILPQKGTMRWTKGWTMIEARKEA
jgi:predicted TPR repeat methyltransferase